IIYSYRTLKELNADSNALKLYEKMMAEDVDYVVFKSARKVGAERTIPLYGEDRKLNTEPFNVPKEVSNPEKPQTIINIPFDIISVQSEVPSKDSHKISRGTQITKLVTLDFMEGGIPIDFKPDLSFEKRFIEWTKLEDKYSYASSIEG